MENFNYQTQRKDFLFLIKNKDKSSPNLKNESTNCFCRNYSSNFTYSRPNTLITTNKTAHKRYLSNLSNQSKTIFHDHFNNVNNNSRNQKNIAKYSASLFLSLSRNGNKLSLMKQKNHNDFIKNKKSHFIKSCLIQPSLDNVPSSISGFATIKLINKENRAIKTVPSLDKKYYDNNINLNFRSIDISPENAKISKNNESIARTIDCSIKQMSAKAINLNEDIKLNEIDEKVESFEDNLKSSSQNNISESLIKLDSKESINNRKENMFDSMSPRSIKELKELSENLGAKNTNARLCYNNYFDEYKVKENMKTGFGPDQINKFTSNPGFKIYPSNIIKYNFDSKFKLVIQTLKKK